MFRRFFSDGLMRANRRGPLRRAWRRMLCASGAGAVAVSVLTGVAPLQAQDPSPAAVELPPVAPGTYLGFRPGADREIADWGQITGYLETLARQSDRVRLDTIGRSTLDRPMLLVTVTDASNQRRLPEIRAVQRKLADPRRLEGPEERRELVRSAPLVALITSGVHPTEVGGSLVPLTLAYRLASANDEETRRILRESVVLIIPAVNPDGVDMVAEWYRQSLDTPWEGSAPPFLYHHYTGHDINRDWYTFTQVETRNVVERVYNSWYPQVVHDMHQQGAYGSRFFVPPWMDPIEPNVDPLLVAAANSLGTAIAWDLIRQGLTGVVVNAGYDAWSPGRAYAHYHGAVRLLSETASARLATPLDVLPEELEAPPGAEATGRTWNQPAPWAGGRWGMSEVVDYMQAGALAFLRNATASRPAWIENFIAVGERAVAGWADWPAAWIVPPGTGNGDARAELLRILTTAQVEVEIATTELRGGGSTWPVGSLLVRMRQPYAAFAQMLLAPQEYPSGRPVAGIRPTPYDVTAHNLPLFLGLRAVPLARPPSGETEPVAAEGDAIRHHASGVSGQPGLLVGLYQPWVPSTDEGWTRWLFDRFEVPYASLRDRELRRGDLSRRFTSIVLPSVDPEVLDRGWAAGSMPVEYTGGLGSIGVQSLREFVEAGGTLVALGRSAGWAAERLDLDVGDRLSGQSPDEFLAPGAQVSLVVDTTTGIGRGMPGETAAWLEGGAAFDLTPGSPAIRIAGYGRRPRVLSGWVRGVDMLANAAAVVEVPVGLGRVVLYGIDPQQRGISLATFPLLFNALRVSR